MRAFGRHADLMRRHNDLLSDKADELEQFAGRVAHDVRNPITAAAMGFESIDRLADGNQRLHDKATRGIANLRRASLLLDGLLGFAQAGARPVPGALGDVRAAVRSCVEELLPVAAAAGAELHSEPVCSGTVRCDQTILELVITNLVRNAIKYIGGGSQKKISLLATEARGFVRIEVRDTGIGVPHEMKDSVFDPFVRGSRGGSGVGLGLATVKKICDRHGGRVGVESNRPCGSIFWFELPAVATGEEREGDVSAGGHAAAAIR
jgi:signal transduction histidine kinase